LSNVRVQSNADLITFQNWTLRVRPATESPERLLLLLHGLTGDENSMWVFVRNFPDKFWIVAPRAFHIAKPGGYSWRRHPAEQDDPPGLADFRPAVSAVLAFVDAYAAECRIEARQFDVIGFSQGAALTNAIALLYPQRVRRAGVLSGFIPAQAESVLAKRPLNGKPFFVAHGTMDEKVKVEYARQSVQMLERAGANVTYCEDEVGHKVSANCLRALKAFFA
jgi:phospholipase/carboxylesterase